MFIKCGILRNILHKQIKCSTGGDLRKNAGQLANYLGLDKGRLHRQLDKQICSCLVFTHQTGMWFSISQPNKRIDTTRQHPYHNLINDLNQSDLTD